MHADAEVHAWFESVVLPEREVWVAEDDDGVLTGLLVLEDDWVDQLYVDPGHTSRGIGGQPDQIFAEYSDRGCSTFDEADRFVDRDRRWEMAWTSD